MAIYIMKYTILILIFNNCKRKYDYKRKYSNLKIQIYQSRFLHLQSQIYKSIS